MYFHMPGYTTQIVSISCDIKTTGDKRELQLRLTFLDKMDRELISELKDGECGGALFRHPSLH